MLRFNVGIAGGLWLASLACACTRSATRSEGDEKRAPAAALSAESSPAEEHRPQPGVVTAADSQTLHMEVPQPDIRVDPEAAAIPEPKLPVQLEPVLGADVLAKVKASGGKATLVNVWASWCGACKVEMPMLMELQKRYASKGIQLLFVSVDEASAADKLLSAINERELTKPWLIAKGSLGYFKLALSPIWQGSLPATFLYDATGKLRYFWGTQAYESEVTSILDGFLAGEAIDGVANVGVMAPPP